VNQEHVLFWTKIKNFELDDPDVDFSFSDRLARENGWSIEFALRAIEEYKKFMFLISVCKEPLTPSDQVDQVWHLHLIYTHSYWEEFCGEILGHPVHHGPTKGGNQERNKYVNLYQNTLMRYKHYFGYEAPKDIWPESSIRFSEIEFRRVNMNRYWVISKFHRLKK